MVSDDEVLARARATWQDAEPTDAEVHQGAQRVGRRLRSHRRASSSRTVWTLAGSVAAFMATLAYAGIGHHRESEDALVTVPSGETSGSTSAVGERPSAGEPRRSLAPSSPLAPLAPREPLAVGAARSPESLSAAPSEAAAPGAAAAPSARGDHQEPTAAAPIANAGGESPRAQAPGSSHIVPFRNRSSKASAPVARGGDDTSWRAVSDALAAGKQWRAEQLLTRLAERGGDANTRAKAKLGLGQLEAARGRCSKARQLALAVAGQNGIETKTVRRALELAARCLR